MQVLVVGYRLHQYLKSEKPTIEIDRLLLLEKLIIIVPFDRSISIDWKFNPVAGTVLNYFVKAAIVT